MPWVRNKPRVCTRSPRGVPCLQEESCCLGAWPRVLQFCQDPWFGDCLSRRSAWRACCPTPQCSRGPCWPRTVFTNVLPNNTYLAARCNNPYPLEA